MKITNVKLRFAKHYLFVQIYTDAGITGLGVFPRFSDHECYFCY